MNVRKEYLAEHVIQEQKLKVCWHISVDAIFTEMLVVFNVVFLREIMCMTIATKNYDTHLESCTVGYSDG